MKEKELCIALGLSRDFMKEIRSSYLEGTDWLRVESKKPKILWEVSWTDEGILKLKENLGIKDVKEIAIPEIKIGTVCSKFRNPKVLEVLIDGIKSHVICRDNTKFGIGMEVHIKWDGVRWCVVKHPRFNGKY